MENPKTANCFEEPPEVIRQRIVDQDDAFCERLAKSPERPRMGIVKTPGTERPGKIRPAVNAPIRSSSGW